MSDAAKPTSKYGAAYRAGWANGRTHGRTEERQRILTQVQQLRDEWIRDYLQHGMQLNINVKKAFADVVNAIEQGTRHEETHGTTTV